MTESLTTPWIHIGECPICGNGLCRLRCCTLPEGLKKLYAMCDECEAIWLQPSTSTEHLFPDSQEPLCPISGGPLYGGESRWALPEDLLGSGWENEVIIDLPTDCALESEDLPYVTGEDVASALDVPTVSLADVGNEEHNLMEPHADDWAYGQDEPRPGC